MRTIARIAVHTAARARVTGTTSSGLVPPAPVGRAGARGWRTLRFGLRRARAGQPIVVTVSVSRHGRTGTCRASFRPRAVPRPWPAPTPVTTLAPPPNSSPPAPAGCHPLSDEGTCYEPGEFCRDSDHGVTGVAGDGKTITCEDNDGWRWEPA